MSVRQATRERVEGAHRFSAFFRGYLANHLPMALVALDAMGADDAVLGRFQARYEAAHLEALTTPAFEIARGDEARYLGDAKAFPAWVAYFEERISADGVKGVLESFIDALMASVGSGAFHGAIRAAYALESGSPREMAHALAYWSAAFEAPAEIVVPSGRESPHAILRALSRDPGHAGKRPAGRNIVEGMRAAMDGEGFRARVESVDPTRLSVESLARTLIRAYAATGDFTLLHGVTGCHAARLLMPFVRDRQAASRRLWAAMVAAHMAAGSPSIEGWGLEGSDALAWPQILARAARCLDEHDVKLAYTCWREWQAHGDDLYRRVASAQVCHALSEIEAC